MFVAPNVAALEFVVPDIDAAVSYFVDVLGMDLAWRGPAKDAPGESAVLDAGSIALTLFTPSANEDGAIAHRQARLSRITLGADASELAAAVARSERAGVPTRPLGADSRYVPPEAMNGILGLECALVLTDMSDTEPSAT